MPLPALPPARTPARRLAPAASPRLLLTGAVAAATALTALVGAAPSNGQDDLRAAGQDPAACAAADRVRPSTLDAAVADRGLAAVRADSGLDRATVAHLVGDAAARVDACGQLYVVDAAPTGAGTGTAAPRPAAADAVPADVLALDSRPSSTRTLFLDFDGSTWSNTAWSSSPVVSPAYSRDGDRTSLNDDERAQVYLAWRTVAEDFAPFDVNVTTRDPGAAALIREDDADKTYGMTVVVTPTNSVGSGCGCGGKAYVNVFGMVDGERYKPAWVFTDGSGTGGYNLAQAVSHEAGHTFGLGHDATSTSGYYGGSTGWAPIMGASYGMRMSQWSAGEYPDANNSQDDVAVIGADVPFLADDHSSLDVAATPLYAGTPVAGLIGSRTDTDTFAFTASGTTTLTVSGPAGVSDLDVSLTVRDARGAVVAVVNPVAAAGASPTDATLDASWSAELPATAASFTATVDGVGQGDPTKPGGYSDYASVGAYTISLATAGTPTTSRPTTSTPTTPTTSTPTPTTSPTPSSTPTPTATPTATPTTAVGPVAFATSRLPRGRAGSRYRADIAFTGPVIEARIGWRMPAGLRWRVQGTRIVLRGTLRSAGVQHLVAELTSVDGTVVRQRFGIRVR